jgi:hypothetical protein
MRTVHPVLVAVLSIGSLAEADTVFVPPVDISVLTHHHQYTGGSPPYTQTWDAVHFPCTGGACNGPGFTTSIGTGDTIVVRFVAPAGTRFFVHFPGSGSQDFYAYAHWQTNSPDASSNVATPSITFENLAGVPPSLASAHNLVSDDGQAVHSENQFTVSGDFSFTALEVQFTVGHSLADVSRTYNQVDSTIYFSFSCFHQIIGSLGDFTVMSIEPISAGPFCFGDGTGTPCPCGNSGSPGHGCQNSSSTGGAQLAATGTTNPDTMVLNAIDEQPTALTIFLQGTQSIQAVAFGDGLRCVNGVLKRLYIKTSSGGAVSAPQGGDLSITARSAQMGHSIAPGSTRYYMTYYRDGAPAFCPSPAGSSFNGSNAWTIHW